jgi:hypothetical protein
VDLHFSEYFGVSAERLKAHGAFDISVVSDLPLFIDPFLLFNSDKPEYQTLHESIIKYLIYLRDAAAPDLDPSLVANLYQFKEVKQNWLGFTELGNGGSGLGPSFAKALHASLGTILANFGDEDITRASHLEKVCLVRGGIGRDNVSDFTTNLIKDYLCEYTEQFAQKHMDADLCEEFGVARARFNYDTETWETKRYTLPSLRGDFVLLTPIDMLTRDDTWISHGDMLNHFHSIPEAVPDSQLRAQINRYFRSQLTRKPTKEDERRAADRTIQEFPVLIDYYIKNKEDDGDRATAVSADRVELTHQVFVEYLQRLVAGLQRTDFYKLPTSSYDEALARARYFKHYIEDQDGYRLINKPVGKSAKTDGKPFASEKEVQLYFGLAWFGSEFDINREPNNGRGPVDFAVSKGSIDKSLIEFKLASNRQLARNLQNQVAIYEAANSTRTSVKVIICYTRGEQVKVENLLRRLKLSDEESIVLIDARRDNKPSGSVA